MNECWGFLKDVFINVFDVELVEVQLSREERQLALKLKKEKYSAADWTFKRKK
jgi:lipoate-protein ligase A